MNHVEISVWGSTVTARGDRAASIRQERSHRDDVIPTANATESRCDRYAENACDKGIMKGVRGSMPTERAHRLGYLCLQATKEGQASHAHVHEIIRGLERRGWHVDLFEPWYAGESALPGVMGRLVAFVAVQWRLMVSWRRVDAVYVRGHIAALPAMIWLKVMRVPIVYEINGPYEDLFIAYPRGRWGERILTSFMRLAMRLSDALVAVTPGLSDWANAEVGPKQIGVIPNGANSQVFKPDAPAFSVDLPQCYAVFFGAMAPWQGIATILRAIDDPAWPREVHMVFVGDGVEAATVAKAATSNPRIRYLGTLPYQHVPGVVAQSVVSLSPQTNASGRAATGLSPLKVFESMACGVPVVVTDFPGQGEMIRNAECGITIPPDDSQALANAIRRLYCDAEGRAAMGARGRAAVEREHSWDSRAADTARVLEQLLGQNA